MDDLTLVGVHDDGEHVVLAAGGGQRFLLRVDEELRAAVRRDRARLGQLQIANQNRLRPRDVQARIRSGRTAEQVAAEAGVPVEYVRRYEGPVLAEREFIAMQAREVRTRPGSGPVPTLGESVHERLELREAGDDVGWDAWRTDEGAWVVAVMFTAGGKRRQAQWSYDPQVRHIAPLDDEARWFTDSDPDSAGPGQARRLAPVPDSGVGPDPGGPGRAARIGADAAGEEVDAHQPSSAAGPDLLDTLRERRGRRTRPVPPSEEDGAGPDPVREAIDSLLSREAERSDRWLGGPPGSGAERAPRRDQSAQPPAGIAPEPRPDPRLDIEHPGFGVLDPYFEPAHPQPAARGEDHAVVILPEAEPLPAPARAGEEAESTVDVDRADADAVPAGRGAPRPARKPRRTSVPSWDDIVFGARRD